MVQAIDSILNKPVYNAVNIRINRPEVNAKENAPLSMENNNGVYNAVKIRIDNPAVNPAPKMIYDYPEAQGIVTYDMAVVQPNLENLKDKGIEELTSEKEVSDVEKKNIAIPEPNFTTVEAEKADIDLGKQTIASENVQFHGAGKDVKKPEIVPPEEIKPEVDIHSVLSKLNDKDFDIQAKQMEEIVKSSIDGDEKVFPYIVKDVFLKLIDIAKLDVSSLAAPTQEQTEIRHKIIANVIAAKTQGVKELPYKLTEKEIDKATELAPIELAERNKEYALYTLAVLSRAYVNSVEKETGNVVPITDVPGVSETVDLLRYNPNPGVKIAALESLAYIQRPEYSTELITIFNIAKSDKNPMVAEAANLALDKLNKN